MSGQRSRVIRSIVRVALQSNNEALLATLETRYKATFKEVRRAAKMVLRKLTKNASKIKAEVSGDGSFIDLLKHAASAQSQETKND